MSWLTKALGAIGHVAVTVAKVVTSPTATAIEKEIPLIGTFVSLINPALAGIINKGSTIVNGVEGLITTAQAGALKKQTAVQIAVAELPQLESLIAQFGPHINIPDAEVGEFLDSVVAMYNSGDKLLKAIAANAKPAE